MIMSGDVNLHEEPIIFYSKKMTMAKMIVLEQKGIKLNLYNKIRFEIFFYLKNISIIFQF